MLLLLCCVSAFAQQQTISGVVTDDQNMPLPGATVLIKGTTNGTQTDFDGNYSIEAADGEILIFSYVGMDTKEVTVGSSNTINVSLTVSTNQLDEVVVVGYGTQKRSDLTGAIVSAKAEEIAEQPALNAMQSLQGKVAGVNIINSDAPGTDPKVVIRGVGTASAGSSPLYVVDGIMVSNIQNISPSDIASVDIMKDASSAAIYGSDAANGVVLITTKSGKAGKSSIKVESFYGAKSVLNPVEMANGQEYITYFNEKQTSTGGAYQLSSNQLNNTDWYDELIGTAFSNNNNVSVSGGAENVDYFFSVNNYNEDGLLKDQRYNRTTIRTNNTFKLFDGKLKLTPNVNLSFTNENPKGYSVFNDAYRQSPLVPVYYESGQYGQSFVNQTTGLVTYQGAPGETIGRLNSIGNPVANAFYDNQKIQTTNIQGLFKAEFDVTDWLKLSSRFGATKYYYKKRVFNDVKGSWLASDPTRTASQFEDLKENNPTSLTYVNNELSYENREEFRYNWDTFLTIDKSFDKHNFNMLLGLTRDLRNDTYRSYVKGYDVPSQEQYWNIDMASSDYDKVAEQGYSNIRTKLSYFGRLQYNFDNKYFITANFRRDGDSFFKENEEYWGNFPSFSAGWVISREEFMSNSGIDFLKIRGGYGKLGNANVPQLNTSTVSTSPGSSTNNYVFGPNQALIFGSSFGTPVTELTWEKTNEVFAGIDISILDSRLSANFDYYNRTTENAIMNVKPLLNSAFQASYYDHGGKVNNEGFEIALNWQDEVTEDFSYSIGVNYGYNKNVLQDVKPAYDGNTGGSLANGQITKRLEEGQPLYAWWMYETEGVWQTQDEIDNNASLESAKPGYLRYKDQNEDGVIDDRDKVFLGSYLPKFNYGINLGLNYKRFDFNLDAFGVGGNKVYNGLKGVRIDGGENITKEVYDNRWTGAGSTNTHPGADRDAVASSYYLEDGDYLRINNISIGYTLSEDAVPYFTKLRIYATAQNPFLFTKYTGFTPELLQSGAPNETAGIELSAYPNVKTFILGVNIEL
ncbi:SusC/RagA family TonB-linked outer membrane protein [Joostella sp. CR20]|uniref:SusC/RagA family TonB-linked outer membrane protein n=1 Tax=Joostella sp. CR20 TaxID=2804312 RepID=UPI00313D2E49